MKNTTPSTPAIPATQSIKLNWVDPPAQASDAIAPVKATDQTHLIASEAPVSAAEALATSLSPEQRQAIQLLTSGHTLAASAAAAGVNRTTLYRWLKGDAAFAAVFNAWQKDIVDTARGRVLALSDLAVTTLAKSLAKGDARTALKLLQSIGALDRSEPGPTDPEEVMRIQNLEKIKANNVLDKAEAFAEIAPSVLG